MSDFLSFTLAALGIWLTIYFYLRQDRAKHDRYYREIIERLVNLSQRVSAIEETVTDFSDSASTQKFMIETQAKLLEKMTDSEPSDWVDPPVIISKRLIDKIASLQETQDSEDDEKNND